MRLLIVDDNPINQKFLYYSLKRFYEIETADNGLDAVRKLDNEEFDIVLMDLSMPVMDGAEATRRIRESINFRNKHIPIIFVTTNDYEHERVRCLEYGGDDYMIKPIDIVELIKTIEFQVQLKKDLV